jgi:hypothetical protein
VLKLLICFSILLLLSVIISLGNLSANWIFHADQEFTLAYNALLVNDGYNQQYQDHPGFFTIHLLGLILKAYALFDTSFISKISELNNTNSIIKAMSEVITLARATAASCVAIGVCIFFLVLNRYEKRTAIAVLITSIFFVSNGVFFHFTQLRTEWLSYLFLVSALYFYIQAYSCRNKSLNSVSLTRFLIFTFLIICACLNKAQIIIYLPIAIFWCGFFIGPEMEIKKNILAPHINKWDKILFIISIAVILILYCNSVSGISIFTNAILIIAINLLIIWHCLKVNISIYRSACVFNIILLILYPTLKIFVEGIDSNVTALFRQIDDPLQMLRFKTGDYSFYSSFNMEKFYEAGPNTKDITLLIKFFTEPITKYFALGRMGSPVVFMISNILLLFLYKKTLPYELKRFIFISFVSFYLVNFINNLRGLTAYYLVYSEYFLMTSYWVTIRYLWPSNIKKITIVLLITFFLILILNTVLRPRYQDDLNHRGLNGDNSISWCIDRALHESYHRNINLNAYFKECEFSYESQIMEYKKNNRQ